MGFITFMERLLDIEKIPVYNLNDLIIHCLLQRTKDEEDIPEVSIEKALQNVLGREVEFLPYARGVPLRDEEKFRRDITYIAESRYAVRRKLNGSINGFAVQDGRMAPDLERRKVKSLDSLTPREWVTVLFHMTGKRPVWNQPYACLTLYRHEDEQEIEIQFYLADMKIHLEGDKVKETVAKVKKPEYLGMPVPLVRTVSIAYALEIAKHTAPCTGQR
ncbi:hypothetical protein HYS48_00335 [Candidatus Woesearchaeota archaeon]|nr:hypothetical protein [Candidatus Woesearchaeota archaeon]